MSSSYPFTPLACSVRALSTMSAPGVGSMVQMCMKR